jgi:23S rRNA (uracil1939-C5)-methyltransferase
METSLSPGQELTLTIDHVGGQGDGVARIANRSVFVPFTLPGEEVRVRILSLSRDSARAERLDILTASPDRQSAPCPHFTECGGCSLLHMSDEAYRLFKAHLLHSVIARLGYDTAVIAPLVEVGPDSRRRAEFKLRVSKGEVGLGFVAARSHEIIPIEQCHVLSPALQRFQQAFLAALRGLAKPGMLVSLAVTEADNGLDVELRSRGDLKFSDLKALQAFCLVHDLRRLTLRNGDAAEPEILHAQGEAEVLLGGYRVALPPGAFLQASRTGQEALTQAVCEALAGHRRIVDIYSGCGTYSLPLVRLGHQVTAYEGDSEMVTALHNVAHQHGLQERFSARQRDLFRTPLEAKELASYDAVVINPPRNGALPQVSELAKSGMARIVMVSCNPATFARDAIPLRDAGYTLHRALPIDQFYGSSHLELVAVFTRSHTSRGR